jgi:hypothetical protein
MNKKKQRKKYVMKNFSVSVSRVTRVINKEWLNIQNISRHFGTWNRPVLKISSWKLKWRDFDVVWVHKGKPTLEKNAVNTWTALCNRLTIYSCWSQFTKYLSHLTPNSIWTTVSYYVKPIFCTTPSLFLLQCVEAIPGSILGQEADNIDRGLSRFYSVPQ